MSLLRPHEARQPREYLIDGLIAKHTVNIMSGPADSGKTTWLLKMMLDFLAGVPVLGGESHPVPITYIVADRGLEDAHEVYDRLEIPDPPPWHTYVETSDSRTIAELATLIPAETQLVIIEGLALYVPDVRVNELGVVAKWIRETRQVAKRNNWTIIGTIHATKTKEKDKIADPRQRALGSIAWKAYADTMIILEPQQASTPEAPGRVMHALPKNHPVRRVDFNVNAEDGKLIEVPRIEPGKIQLLTALPQGVDLATASIHEYGEKLGLSRSTITRLLNEMKSTGELESVAHGVFRRPVPKGLLEFEGGAKLVMPGATSNND